MFQQPKYHLKSQYTDDQIVTAFFQYFSYTDFHIGMKNTFIPIELNKVEDILAMVKADVVVHFNDS
jgi:hypothetical protein